MRRIRSSSCWQGRGVPRWGGENVAHSEYGQRVSSAYFLQDEPSAPERSTESVDASCMPSSKLNASFPLPTAVWDTVSDQVPPPEDESEEERNNQQTEEDRRGGAALGPGYVVPVLGVRNGDQLVEPLALRTPPSLEPPRGMRIAAAKHLPHRNEGQCWYGMSPPGFRHRYARVIASHCARCQSP